MRTAGLRLFSVVGVVVVGWSANVFASTPWSQETHKLFVGDFNADGKSDLLYIAKDIGGTSGIALSNSAEPAIDHQSWSSNFLGIVWHGSSYNPIVADFNGDDRDDVLMQAAESGNSFLILTDTQGRLSAISQTIPHNYLGQNWPASEHRIIAGDFNGDNRADLFLQGAKRSVLNAVYLSDAYGQFTSSAQQSWGDDYLGFKWTAPSAVIHAGDFNGDGKADLLIQAKPDIVLIDYDIPIPVPVYRPQSFGVVPARAISGGAIFYSPPLQMWSKTFGADWSEAAANIVIGDFSGDGKSDIFLQPKKAGGTASLFVANSSGQFSSTSATIDSGLNGWTPSQYALLAANFDGNAVTGLYLQATTSAGTNSVAAVITSGTVSTTTHTPSAPPVATAVGRTEGMYGVSSSGAATYSIPLPMPPGALGIAPKLTLTYNSQSSGSYMGPGWSLNGLPVITRCPKTWAQDGAPAAVTLIMSDRFCLDGNRLRETSGTYGAADSEYQTEIANFTKIVAKQSQGNGPAWFEVKSKDGLIYEFGNINTGESSNTARILAPGTSTAYAWALNKVRDRQGNNMTVSYQVNAGGFVPFSIRYTQTPATGTIYRNVLSFFYLGMQPEEEIVTYIAGSEIRYTKKLIGVYAEYQESSGATVEKTKSYKFEYNTSPTTLRTRLKSVQECSYLSYSQEECLAPTKIVYQDGTAGIESPSTSAGTGSTAGRMTTVDIDGDGKQDLIYALTSGSSVTWHARFGTTSGYSSTAVPLNLTTDTWDNLLYGDFLGNGQITVLATQSGYWKAVRWDAGTSNFAAVANVVTTPGSANLALDSGTTSNTYANADVNGDGLPDLVSLGTDSKVYLRLNTSSGNTVSFSSTQTLALNGAPYEILSVHGNNFFTMSNVRRLDFNGDGREDLVGLVIDSMYGVNYGLMLSNGAGFDLIAGYGGFGSGFMPIDFNNDACTDMVSSTSSYKYVYVWSCGGTQGQSLTFTGTPAAVADWNSDGKSDLIVDQSGSLKVYLSQSTALSSAVSMGVTAAAGNYEVSDINGDGQDDITFAAASGGYPVTYGLHKGVGAKPDLVTSVSDGYGVSFSPSYVSMARGNYTKYTTGDYPNPDFGGSQYVVSQFSASTGSGGVYTNTFHYFGAQKNKQGRGFSGFATRRMIDGRNGLYSYEYYRQDFPYTGMVSERRLYQPDNSTFMARTVNTLSHTVLESTSGKQRYFPFTDVSTSYEYQAGGSGNGNEIKRTMVDNTFDSYGNATQVQTSVVDKDATASSYNETYTETVNKHFDYTTAATNWCIKLPDQTTVQRTLPNTASATRTSGMQGSGIDYANCRVTDEVIEPSGGNLKVAMNYTYAASGCGNPTAIAVTGRNNDGGAMTTRTTNLSYDSVCLAPVSSQDPMGNTTQYTRIYGYNRVVMKTDPNGLSVVRDYDDFDRIKRETRADGTQAQWSYAVCGQANGYCGTGLSDVRSELLEVTKDYLSGEITRQYRHFDNLARVRSTKTKLKDGGYSVVTSTYDALGRLSTRTVPYIGAENGKFKYVYDLADRVVEEQLLTSAGVVDRKTTVAYAGRKVTTTDPKNKVMDRYQDVLGNLRKVQDPSPGGTTEYTYDPFNNLTQIKDAANNLTSMQYNLRGFVTQSSDPDRGTWNFELTSLGEMTKQTDAKGQIVKLEYDDLSRLKRREETEGFTRWHWGASAASKNIGRLDCVDAWDSDNCAASASGYREKYTYDSLGRIQQKTLYMPENPPSLTTYHVDYSYGAHGGLETLTYPESIGNRLKVKYEYTNGVLSAVKDYTNNVLGTTFWSLSATDARGNPTTEVLGNGVQQLSTFDLLTGLMSDRRNGTGGSTTNLHNMKYSWDKNGSLESREDLNQVLNETFYYDALNRLDRSTLNGTENMDVTLDSIGNITYRSDVGNYTYDATKKHAVKTAGSNTYDYDANGNMNSRNGVTTPSWYSYNLPNQISNGSQSSTFSYAPDRSRWRQVATYSGGTETTIYVAGLMEKVTVSGTMYRHYIPLGSNILVHVRSGTNTERNYYVTADHLGGAVTMTCGASSNPVDSTCTSGSLYLKQSFGAYGTRRDGDWVGSLSTTDLQKMANASRRGFTGHEHLDNLNLIHMNGRIFDPVVGRFMSADPYLDWAQGSQGLNRYSYVSNKPLSLIDPTGFRSSCIDFESEYGYVSGNEYVVRGITQHVCIEVSDEMPTIYAGAIPVVDPNAAPMEEKGDQIQEVVVTAKKHQKTQEEKCWNAGVGFGGAVQGPVVGPAGVGVSAGLSVGVSYGGSLLDSRFFAQVQVAGMVGTGVYAGAGLSVQGGADEVPQGSTTTTTSHSELNVGVGAGGSVIVDVPVGQGETTAGGYHGRLPGGRLGVGLGASAGTGLAIATTYAIPTFREILSKLGINTTSSEASCAQ